MSPRPFFLFITKEIKAKITKILLRAVFCVYLTTRWTGLLFAQEIPFNIAYEIGRDAFLSGNYSVANSQFEYIDTYFSSETEYLDPTFNKPFLSMRGMSSLMSRDFILADGCLNQYLERYYEASLREAVLLMGSIQCKKSLKYFDELLPLYHRFLVDYPNHSDRHFVAYELILLHLQLKDFSEAVIGMNAFLETSAPNDLKTRVVLVIIQSLIREKDHEGAVELLLSQHWNVSSMPELSLLANCALVLGDFCLSEKDYERAIEAFRLVPFHQELIVMQRERYQELSQYIETSNSITIDSKSALRANYYQTLLLQLELELQQLEETEDYTPAYLLKFGRSFLFASRYAEAWVLFRTLSHTEGLDAKMKEEAWFHWILSSHGAGNLDEARKLCFEFEEKFPHSPLLPKSLYLLAQTHQDAGDLIRANLVLTDLMVRFPNHVDYVNWLLTRGVNFASLNENEFALIDYEEVLSYVTISEQVEVRCRFWKSISLSSQNQFLEAVEELNALILQYSEHWMLPDFYYRLAMNVYSLGDYPNAEERVKDYLRRFPDHSSQVEAKVLLGDIYMGEGELDRGIEQFRSIENENPELYMYAVFQIGKIYRAQESYDRMQDHFQAYVSGDEFKGKARISEALYWCGWACTQLNRDMDAVDLYLDAIERYGNDLDAGELLAIVDALSELKKRISCDEVKVPRSSRATRFANLSSFPAWIEGQMKQAELDETHTYLARLKLYEAFKMRKSGDRALADSAIRNISIHTPFDALDDQLLGEIGVALAEDGFESCLKYLRRLLIRYPRSAYKGSSYYGMALFEFQNQRYDDALQWLALFEKESPHGQHLIPVKLLKAQAYLASDALDEAVIIYNDILKLKQARGEPHVEALEGLARAYQMQDCPELAIPYWQRIYTLYRAFSPFVAKAYYESALLFDALGRENEAFDTCMEMLAQKDLIEFSERSKVLEFKKELEARGVRGAEWSFPVDQKEGSL